MSIRFVAAGLMLAAGLLTGCATPVQGPVELDKAALSAPSSRIGVAMTAVPKVDTSFPGAGCLLCYAAASVANSGLTAHANKLPTEDLGKLKEMLAERLAKQGAQVKVIAEAVKLDDLPSASGQGTNVARKDFGALARKHDVDKIVVLSIDLIGFERTYAAYVPTGDPKAVVRGTAFLVDAKTNGYGWYQPVSVMRASDGPWDEPSGYPGLTNAYFQALETSKDQFLAPFKP